MPYHFNQQFVTQDFCSCFEKGEYEQCHFSGCRFHQVDLQETLFISCTFDNCDLSMASLNNTGFQEVKFKDCKLMGLRFDKCQVFLLSFDFEACILNFSSFYQLNLKKMTFQGCTLHEVDFVETNLTEATFEHCDLTRSHFEQSILEKADFRTALYYTLDPDKNRIRGAKFSKEGALSLLQKYQLEIF